MTVEITYQLERGSGWCLDLPSGEKERATELTAPFLPIVLEFLRRRPRLKQHVGIVLQSRGLDGQGVGTVMTLQELPDTQDESEVAEPLRLLAPAVYALSDVQVQEGRVKMVLPQAKRVNPSLKDVGWCYDLVLRVRDIDDTIDAASSRLTAKVEVVPPHQPGFRLIPGVWLPCERNAVNHLGRCVCIPWLPPAYRFGPLADTVLYVLAGKTASDNLMHINEVWQRPGIRNLLIPAGPGSGKEIAARLVHHGRARGRFMSASVGGECWDSWRIPMLGEGRPGGATVLRGLIEDSVLDGVGGTVFVDEVDKGDKSIRQALLRIVESDEYRRPGNGELIRFVGEQRPLFVFTGSGEGTEGKKLTETDPGASVERRIREEAPKDFWQRIDWTLNIENPINGNEATVVPAYLALFMERTWAKDRMCGPHVYAADRLLEMDRAEVDSQVRTYWHTLVQLLYHGLAAKGWGAVGKLRIIRTTAEEAARGLAKTARLRKLDEAHVRDVAAAAIQMACSGA